MGSQTTVTRQVDGSSIEKTVSQSDGQAQTDYVHRDPSGFVTALRHETRQQDADGNQTIDRATQVFDQQGHMADANGNPVSDSTTPVSNAAPAPDGGGGDAGSGDGGSGGGEFPGGFPPEPLPE
ncbi:hypothetical protein [Streptomyces sp. NPDC051662]|uniref:hypothetical protein n=1 Tax=Streptomyces sp. NPDC051662 TaxID=3154750 RepID=UPI003448E4E2